MLNLVKLNMIICENNCDKLFHLGTNTPSHAVGTKKRKLCYFVESFGICRSRSLLFVDHKVKNCG